MDDQHTVIELLRHGEPVGGSRYRGQLDDALSERGWKQMWQAVGGRPLWQQVAIEGGKFKIMVMVTKLDTNFFHHFTYLIPVGYHFFVSFHIAVNLFNPWLNTIFYT